MFLERGGWCDVAGGEGGLFTRKDAKMLRVGSGRGCWWRRRVVFIAETRKGGGAEFLDRINGMTGLAKAGRE
jgi:hypothetical protein